MAIITLGAQVRYYGTAEEIQAVSANKGDIGYTPTGVQYVNTDGGTTWVSTSGLVDSNLAISSGLVPGQTVVNKFGSNEAVGSGTEEVIWDGGGTSYPFPATALMTKLVQATDEVLTDANATIEIQGLDANWALVTQTADLDGADTTTEVTLTTPLIRCFRMKVLEDIVLAANVSVVATGGGTTYATITTGNNQTLMAIYTVPAGKTAYMTSYYCDYVRSTAQDPNGVEFRLWVADRDNGYEFQIKNKKGVPKQTSGFQHEFKPYFKINAKNDIMITAEPADFDADVHAGFDLILVDQ